MNGKLTKTFFNRVCSLMPRFFVFENVAGLYRVHVHREFLKKLEKKLESKGYCLDLRILNALEMGIPQDRERLILIGIESRFAGQCAGRKIGSSERDWFPWPDIPPPYRGARAGYNWPQICKFGGRPKRPKGTPYELMVDSVLNSGSLPEEIANGKDVFAAYSERFSSIEEGDTKTEVIQETSPVQVQPHSLLWTQRGAPSPLEETPLKCQGNDENSEHSGRNTICIRICHSQTSSQ